MSPWQGIHFQEVKESIYADYLQIFSYFCTVITISYSFKKKQDA